MEFSSRLGSEYKMTKCIECKKNLHLKDFKIALSNGFNPRKNTCLCDSCQNKVFDDILANKIKVTKMNEGDIDE